MTPPPAKSTRAKALGIQPFRLDTLHTNNRIAIKAMPLTAAQQPNNRITAKVMPSNRDNAAY